MMLYKYFSGVVLAFILWYLMFVVKPIENFWILMVISTSLLSVISITTNRKQLSFENFNYKEILIGLFSAVILYLVFFAGKNLLDVLKIIPNHQQNISNVYASRGMLPAWTIALFLFFPVGFGEEIFWRGYLQRMFSEKYGNTKSFLLTTFFYTAIHIPTLNPVLILAAFLVGIYWGLIFIWRKNNIVAPMVSHMVWDPVIFIILPFS